MKRIADSLGVARSNLVERVLAPVPSILERLNLRSASVAGRAAEKDIVVGFGIERRVKVDQINASRLKFAQYLKAAPEIQRVFHGLSAGHTTPKAAQGKDRGIEPSADWTVLLCVRVCSKIRSMSNPVFRSGGNVKAGFPVKATQAFEG